MTRPVRLRLSRSKGFDLQALSRATNGLDAVNVARPSKWGNPFRWQDCSSDAGPPGWAKGAAVDLYRSHIHGAVGGSASAHLRAVIGELCGRNLACWCKSGEPCHADVLLKLANGDAK